MCAGVKWNLSFYMTDSWYSLPAEAWKDYDQYFLSWEAVSERKTYI